MTFFDAIKNGIASEGYTFKQFDGVEFEHSSLAKLSPLGVSRGTRVAHGSSYRVSALRSQTILFQYASAPCLMSNINPFDSRNVTSRLLRIEKISLTLHRLPSRKRCVSCAKFVQNYFGSPGE
jgi:hypothetical protein